MNKKKQPLLQTLPAYHALADADVDDADVDVVRFPNCHELASGLENLTNADADIEVLWLTRPGVGVLHALFRHIVFFFFIL